MDFKLIEQLEVYQWTKLQNLAIQACQWEWLMWQLFMDKISKT